MRQHISQSLIISIAKKIHFSSITNVLKSLFTLHENQAIDNSLFLIFAKLFISKMGVVVPIVLFLLENSHRRSCRFMKKCMKMATNDLNFCVPLELQAN